MFLDSDCSFDGKTMKQKGCSLLLRYLG